MNYPESIYSNFEIIERDIHGERHYGLVKHYEVFGIKFKRHLKIDAFMDMGRIDWESGRKWHNKKVIITSAINDDRGTQEYKFRRRVTK